MSEVMDREVEEKEEEAVVIDHLAMSDEDFLKAGPPAETPVLQAEPETDKEVVEEVVTDKDDEEDKEDAEEDADEGAADKASDEEAADEGKDAKEEVKAEESQDKKPDAFNYEEAYKKLLAPFKANGREIAVKDVDEAIVLMQMGANYNKKMAALKPNLKLMKMLEHNNLLSEEKLSFLIDLEKKNPQAINKLVKDSGLDPMDLDAEKAKEYKQTTYTVDDREVELDTVLDDLQGTPTYNRTLEIVGNKWDSASKQVISNSPQLLKVINDHVSSGIYDLISKEIESERMFGRLNGLSDIEAYRQVGDSIQARGGFNHLAQGSSQNQGQPAAPGTVVVPQKPKKVDDDKLKDKRRAASSPKPAASHPAAPDFNPLALSDAEFSKIAQPRYR